MVAKKKRTPVVLDTNVFVRAFLSRNKSSLNRKIVRLWLVERQLQLIVSAEILAEYLEIFEEVLRLEDDVLEEWRTRFVEDRRTTIVGLSTRFTESRDPDDNLMLATAKAGKAQYLISNDRDLLDLPVETQARLPFIICRPEEFLRIWEP